MSIERLPALAALACLLLCPSIAAGQTGGPAIARIVDATGKVTVTRAASGQTLRGAPGQALGPGDTLSTGSDGKVTLLMADETLMQLNRNTRFTLKQVERRSGWSRLRELIEVSARREKSVYELLTGELWLLNKNRDVELEVVTPTVTAGVRGTEFNINVDPEARVNLTVLEGTVRAFNPFGQVEARAGEQVFAAPGTAPVTRVLVNPEDAVQWLVRVPRLFSPREIPLLSSDHGKLDEERRKLEVSGPGAPGASTDDVTRYAMVLRDLGRVEQAKAQFERVLATDPLNVAARTGLGWCLLDLNEPGGALAEFMRVDSARALAGRGASLMALNRLEEAESELTRAGTRYPDDGVIAAELALVEMLGGRLNRAGERLRSLAASRPDLSIGWQVHAINAVLTNQPVAAGEAAARAVALSPRSASARIIQAYAHQSVFDLERAEESLRAALELDEDNVTALINLAEILFGSDRTDDAQDLIARADAIAPGNSQVQNLKGFILLARRGDQEAINAFLEAAALDPGLADARLGLGIAYMREGDPASAFESVTMALALDPRRAMFYTYWGRMLHQTGRFDKALDVLDRASALDPRDPSPLFIKAIILRDLNRPGEAVRVLNRAVTLNDNRAVYRSRYLLDKDLAVKNVDLSILYDQLGLNAWARRKALTAVKSDYLNHAGHLFYAGALSEEPDRFFSFGAEQLLARLLQPANVNTFNTFNEYTSFFERPSLDAQVTAGAGSNGRRTGEALAFASVPDANLAMQGALAYESTDGWRDTNFERIANAAAILKWEATPRDGVLFSASHVALRQGDENFPRFEFDAPSSPDDRLDSNLTRLELGYHHHFGPGSDLLAYLTRVRSDGRVLDNTSFPIGGLPGFSFLNANDVMFSRPYYQGQVQQIQRFGDHTLLAGTLQYWSDNEADVRDDVSLVGPGLNILLPPPFSTRTSNFHKIRFESYYLQDTWQVTPTLTFEGALYYDRMKNSNAVNGTSWQLDEFNPRGGVIWSPTSADTVRIGAFRYLLPLISARVDPTDIAGITMFRNVEEGALIKEADVVWEHEWDSGLLTSSLFFVKKSFTDGIVVGGVQQLRKRRGIRKGWDFELNQLLSDRIGLSARYRYTDAKDETLPGADRKEHLFNLGIRYVRPDGISAGIEQIHRRMNFKRGRANEHLWSTDLDFAYEFPGKTGSFTFEIRNLFDQEYNWVTDRFVFEGEVPDREVFATISLNF